MRKLGILLVALLAFGGLAVVAPGAGAAVPSESAQFCKDIKKLGNSQVDNSDMTKLQKNAKALATKFKAASKHASAKVKKAMNTISGFLSSIASMDAAGLAKLYSGNGIKNFSSAMGVYAAAATSCA